MAACVFLGHQATCASVSGRCSARVTVRKSWRAFARTVKAQAGAGVIDCGIYCTCTFFSSAKPLVRPSLDDVAPEITVRKSWRPFVCCPWARAAVTAAAANAPSTALTTCSWRDS